jgi:hypothetical protein
VSRVEVVAQGLPGEFGGLEKLADERPVGWLINKWLAARELSVIYGMGGTFKSYIALSWSLQLALDGYVTMYIAAEGTSGLRSRVDAWLAKRGLLGKVQMPTWHYYNANVFLDDDTTRGMWLSGLSKYVKERAIQSPDLVVVDTLARNFSGDESSPKEMGLFIEGCEQVRRELDTAVVPIHHMGVSTGRERGTLALRNASFAMFKTSDPRYTKKGGGSIKLECDRMKDAPLPDEVRCKFTTVELDVSEHGEVYSMSQAMNNFPPRPKKGAK